MFVYIGRISRLSWLINHLFFLFSFFLNIHVCGLQSGSRAAKSFSEREQSERFERINVLIGKFSFFLSSSPLLIPIVAYRWGKKKCWNKPVGYLSTSHFLKEREREKKRRGRKNKLVGRMITVEEKKRKKQNKPGSYIDYCSSIHMSINVVW